jgi:hypothetical protein
MFPIQDTVQARNVPLVTWALILLNGVVFFYEVALAAGPTRNAGRGSGYSAGPARFRL